MGMPMGFGDDGDRSPIPNDSGNQARGTESLARHPSPVRPPGGGDRARGSMADGREPSGTHLPDHRFSVDELRYQKAADRARGSAVTTGKGLIPVDPPAAAAAPVPPRRGK